MEFDYGVDSRLLSNRGEVKKWPTTGSKIGLFDADTVPYLVGYTSSELEYLKFKRSPDMELSDIWQDKIGHASSIINSTLEGTGCDAALFFLTNSEKNFRLNIGTLKEYKGQRVKEKPPFFHELKQWLQDFHGARMSKMCEADDEISIEAWRRYKLFAEENGADSLFTPAHRVANDFIILSQDKDLNIIPGLHNTVGKSGLDDVWVDRKGWLEPKYKESEVNGYEYWPLFQGEEVDPRGLISFKVKNHDIFPLPYHELKEECNGWEKKLIWCKLNSKMHIQEQDKFLRGVHKGLGKFKKVYAGKKPIQHVTKLSGAGLMFFYAQLIMGDHVDNYPGLPGKGPKAAFDILDGADDELDMYLRVRSAYKDYYPNNEYALEMLTEQGQLAWMQTSKFELWQPPTKERGSYPL